MHTRSVAVRLSTNVTLKAKVAELQTQLDALIGSEGGMTERTTNKAKIEALLQAGRTPREMTEILGVARRYAAAVAWRMRNPESEEAMARSKRPLWRAQPSR